MRHFTVLGGNEEQGGNVDDRPSHASPPLGFKKIRSRKRRKRRSIYMEKSDRRLRIDDVRAFVVPLDIEVSTTVPWLEVRYESL